LLILAFTVKRQLSSKMTMMRRTLMLLNTGRFHLAQGGSPVVWQGGRASHSAPACKSHPMPFRRRPGAPY
jgi:hypothetical protein